MKFCNFCDSYNAKKRMSELVHLPFANQEMKLDYEYKVALIENVYKTINGRKRKSCAYIGTEYKLKYCPVCGKEIGK